MHFEFAKVPSGNQLYLEQCACCHGSGGLGDGPTARASNLQLHSFKDCDWMNLMSDATLYLIISDGASAAGFQSGMPQFKGNLTHDQIVDLITYIRHFCE